MFPIANFSLVLFH